MSEALVAVLRVVGLVWALGGVFIMLNARAAGDTDAGRWTFVGGALTFVAGLMLLLASPWALVPTGLVILHQTLFHRRQRRELARAGGAPPPPTQILVAAVVGVLASVAFWPQLAG